MKEHRSFVLVVFYSRHQLLHSVSKPFTDSSHHVVNFNIFTILKQVSSLPLTTYIYHINESYLLIVPVQLNLVYTFIYKWNYG